MSEFISSVAVTFCPKDSSLGLKSLVIGLDHNSGCTLPHAIHFIIKNPLVKSNLSNYFISNLTFKYSTL